MKNKYGIIKGPWVTEKSNDLMMENNVIAMRVSPDATKGDVKQSIEEIFNVTVTSVRTMHVVGKKRRVGKSIGKKSNWKKAYVTLKEGDKIEVVEGV